MLQQVKFYVVLSLAISGNAHSQTRRLEDCLADVDIRNRQISALSWQCECRTGTTENNVFSPTQEYSRTKAILEPATGRCRFHIESIQRDSATNKYFGERSIIAFDGKRALHYRRQNPTAVIPEARPGPGLEDSTPPNIASIHTDVLPESILPQKTGIAFVLGNAIGIPIGQLVDRARRDKRRIEFESDGRVDRIRIQQEKTEHVHEFDREKQSFLRHEMVWLDPRHIIKEIKIELRIIEGIWLPQRVVSRHTLDPWTQICEFSNWKVNQFVDESVYTFSFPQGSRVDDHIDKKTYVVGNSPIDEAKAIRTYLAHHEIEPPKKKWYQNIWVIGATVVAVVVVAAGVYRYRKHASAVVSWLVIASNFSLAGDPQHTHKLECGFQVGVAVLEFHRVEFDPAKLSEDLIREEKNGISLNQLQRTFRQHGLIVEARSQLRLEEARKVVKRGWLAIVPVEAKTTCGRVDFGPTAGRVNHYLMMWNHPKNGLYVIDIFRPPVAIEKSGLTDAHFQDPKSAVLFIRSKRD